MIAYPFNDKQINSQLIGQQILIYQPITQLLIKQQVTSSTIRTSCRAHKKLHSKKIIKSTTDNSYFMKATNKGASEETHSVQPLRLPS